MLAEFVTDDCSWTRDSLSAVSPIRFSESCLKRLLGFVQDHSVTSEVITDMVVVPSLHTDASFHPRPPDYAGLLCLRVAKRGGTSQLASAYSIHNRLMATEPDLLRVLYDSFVFDRRGEYEPGDSATSEASVFSWDGAELTVRYLDLYIREGHRLAERRLTKEQQSALRAIENLCSDPALQVEFGLGPGQMLFVNNHWILHNRTSFEDHHDPTLRRHLLRLWLSRRPVQP